MSDAGAEFLAALEDRARQRAGHVVLAEGDEPRVREAAQTLLHRRLARTVTLLGDAAAARWARDHAGAVQVRTPATDPRLGAVAELLQRRRPDRVADRAAALALAADPLRFAAGLVALGEADATVGGAVATTAEVLRAALWAVGPAPGITTVSSSFYMVTDSAVLTFADCGVVQYPDAAQLADIALAAAVDRRRIVGDQPRVAFLSHSTRGSAAGPSIDRVREAVKLFRSRSRDPADGELQVDAAIVPEVAARKSPDSELNGKANVLIFPDLDSGNIAYKLVQRLSGAVALGPVVQGLAMPCCDLSRGASAGEIATVAVIALLQSQP